MICQNSCRSFTLYNVFGHVRSMVSQATYPEVILLKLQSVFLLQHNLFKKERITRLTEWKFKIQLRKAEQWLPWGRGATEKRQEGNFRSDENALSRVGVPWAWVFVKLTELQHVSLCISLHHNKNKIIYKFNQALWYFSQLIRHDHKAF